jgi:hypothetical protein
MKQNEEYIKFIKDNELDKEPCYGFYDWFCTNKALPARSRRLMRKMLEVFDANKVGHVFDQSKIKVFFKNNCPCVGKLYDDFRICDKETGEVLFTIVPASGFDRNFGQPELWARIKDSEKMAEIRVNEWSEVVEWFKED